MNQIKIKKQNDVYERAISFLLNHPRLRETAVGRKVTEVATRGCIQKALQEITEEAEGIEIPVKEEYEIAQRIPVIQRAEEQKEIYA